MPYMTEDEITAMKKGQSKEMSSLDLIKLAMTNTSTGHIKALFSTPRLAFSTSLITVIYGTLGLAYPLFYAFLGTYLEAKLGEVGSGDNSINATYGAYVYQAACGIPGSFLAAAMVEIPRGGRKFAMAFFTLCAGLFLFGLTQSRNAVQVNALTCMAAFFSNAYCTSPFHTTAVNHLTGRWCVVRIRPRALPHSIPRYRRRSRRLFPACMRSFRTHHRRLLASCRHS